jgi:TolB protein
MNDETREIREQLFFQVVLGLTLTGLVSSVVMAWFFGPMSIWFLRAVALVVIALFALVVQKSGRYMVAAYVLIFELMGIILSIWLSPAGVPGFTPYLFVPLIIIASLILPQQGVMVSAGLATGLTFLALLLTQQISWLNLRQIIPPVGLTLLTAILVSGNAYYQDKLSNLLLKNRVLLRDRTREMVEAQTKVASLNQRVCELERQLGQIQGQLVERQQQETRQDRKFYQLLQGTIRELNHLVKDLEANLAQMVDVAPAIGQLARLETTWQTIDQLMVRLVTMAQLTDLQGAEVQLSYQVVDVTRLVAEIRSSAQALVAGKNIEIQETIAAAVPLLLADPARLRQILITLINHSIRSIEAGRIDIEIKVGREEVVFAISDSEPSLPEQGAEIRPDAFGQPGDPLVTARPGSGIDLAICNRLVDLHGGRMWLINDAAGGMTYSFALPLRPAQAGPVATNQVTANGRPAGPVRAERLSQGGLAAGPKPVPAKSRPGLQPILPPVARLSSRYINRFSWSLLGLLLLIAGIAALSAFFNRTAIGKQATAIAVTGPPPGSPTVRVAEGAAVVTRLVELPAGAVITPTATATPEAVRLTATPTTWPSPTPTLIPPPLTELPSPSPTPSLTSSATPTVTASPTLVTPPTVTASPTLVTPTVTASPTLVTPTAPVPTPLNPAGAEPGRGNDRPNPTTRLRLAFMAGNQIIGHDLRPKASRTWPAPLENAENSRPSWSATGQLLVTNALSGNREIYRIDPVGAPALNLTGHPADDQQPAWSPDGEWIAFSSGRDGNFNIYVMDKQGTRLRQLSASRGFDEWPAWSPDGRYLAFVSSRDGGNQEIYLMEADGSNQRRLTNHPADDTMPVWSPDGQRLLFTSERDGHLNLYIIDLTPRAEPLRLTNDPGAESQPAWGPDGRTIAFVATRPGRPQIFTLVLPPDGLGSGEIGPWTQLTQAETAVGYPVWLPEGFDLYP